MSNVELARATDRRLRAEDFRSDAFRRHALDRERAEDEINVGGSVNLQKLEEQLARDAFLTARETWQGSALELAMWWLSSPRSS